MKTLLRVMIATAVFACAGTISGLAQIQNGLDFTTSFPFYAQNTKMPAGSYRVTPVDFDTNTLLIESTDGKYSAFVDFIPTRAEQPHKQADVTFHKYGNVEYLNRLWVDGQRYGMKVEPTKSEKKAAASAKAVEHSVPGKKRG
jgi:hypothetical protein